MYVVWRCVLCMAVCCFAYSRGVTQLKGTRACKNQADMNMRMACWKELTDCAERTRNFTWYPCAKQTQRADQAV
jgi:hypothetical protein